MKCVNCKYCIGYQAIGHVYMCGALKETMFLDEAVANDEFIGCDLYEPNLHNDDTEKGDQ